MAIANCLLRRAPPRERLQDGVLVQEDDVPSSADGEMSEVRVGSVVVVTEGSHQHRFSFPATTPTSSTVEHPQQPQQTNQSDDFNISERIEIVNIIM